MARGRDYARAKQQAQGAASHARVWEGESRKHPIGPPPDAPKAQGWFVMRVWLHRGGKRYERLRGPFPTEDGALRALSWIDPAKAPRDTLSVMKL